MAEEQEKTAPGEEQAVSEEKQPSEEPSLLEEVIQATKLQPTDEAYSLTKKGLEAFMAQLVEPGRVVDKVTKANVDEMIAEIDNKLSLQLSHCLQGIQVFI